MSWTISANRGSLDSLTSFVRCGFGPCVVRFRYTPDALSPTSAP